MFRLTVNKFGIILYDNHIMPLSLILSFRISMNVFDAKEKTKYGGFYIFCEKRA